MRLATQSLDSPPWLVYYRLIAVRTEKEQGVGVSLQELEARYAGAVSAKGARFISAKHVPDALARLGLVRPQDRLVVYADDFQDVFTERFPRESLFFVPEPTAEAFSVAAPASAEESHTFWFVNSIGGRGLRVPNLRTLATVAHDTGAALIADNTVPSLFGCQPLVLGADLCFEALDRVAAGKLTHKTVAVAWSRTACQTKTALCLKKEGLDYSFLSQNAVFAKEAENLTAIEHGLNTLPERMQRHFDHARAIAEYLSCCDVIPSVAYPGLSSHLDHAVAANVLLHGYGPAIDFELPAHVTASSFIRRCRLNGRNCAAGGPHTRLSARDGGEARFIRLFAGLDDPLAIADDLDQAMRWFCNPPEP